MSSEARRVVLGIVAIVLLGGGSVAATFGTAVPVRGTASDIVLDESRGQLYISNFTAGRVEVMNTSTLAFGAPLTVAGPPSSVALSPDHRYLVVGEYCNLYAAPSPVGGYAIFDLNAGTKREVVLGNPVLAVAFGAGNQALVVTGQATPATCGTAAGGSTTTAGQFLLLDPVSGSIQVLGVSPAGGADLPVAFATFPANITFASTGISGDQQTIIVLTEVAQGGGGGQGATGTTTALLYYKVGSGQVNALNWVATPPFGPRAISVNQDGTRFVAGWILFDLNLAIEGSSLAQFPYPLGDYRLGGFAFDYSRNVIYGDIPVSPTEAPVMHIFATDNLTVLDRIQLPQMIAGRSLFSSDMNTMYAISDEGVMVLPIGSLATAPQVAAQQEDAVFLSNTCNSASISQTINVVDLGGNNTAFTLSLPPGTNGIQLSATSGTTPAQVQISVDVSVYQNAKGTTTIPLTIGSSQAINIPPPVRLLINTRDLNQRGQIVDVPGKIVDILADPVRTRVYLLRQDKNEVLVYDSGTLQQIGTFRTGNTPVGMAFTTDDTKLIVTSDNSQIANVFDLTSLSSVPSSFPMAACAGQANGGPVSAECGRGSGPGSNVERAAGVTGRHDGVLVRRRAVGSADFLSGEPGALDPILFRGAYPHSIAVGNGEIWAAVRAVTPPQALYRVDMGSRFAAPPPNLGIYDNTDINAVPPTATLVASPSGNSIFLAEPGGTVVLWDAFSGFWVVSRQDLSSLGGAYGALNDNLFVADNHVFDQALSPIAQLESTTGSSSGVGVSLDPEAGVLAGLRTTVSAPSAPGILERFGIDPANSAFYLQTYNGTAITEAPVTAASLQTTTVGQIGQTILPFTRTLAVPADQGSVILLTQSGLTVLPADFDAALAVPSVSGVVNSADGGTDIAPGSLILISGTNLAPDSAVAGTPPLPSTLGDTCVMVDNIPLPLFQVSPTQILAQLPLSVGGSEPLVIHSPGGLSSPFTLNIGVSAPAVLHTAVGDGQSGLPNVIRDNNGQPVDFTNPIHPNQALSIYLDGLGPTVPVVPPGVPSPSNPPAVLATPPVVTLEGVTLAVTFAGLDPGQIGVYRVDVTVPYSIGNAAQAALVITAGTASTSLQVRVVNP
jgi:uncharacterized protein (TIGR03437 family)